MNRPPLRFITTFGLGHMRPASGTWGSLPTVIIASAMILFGTGPNTHPIAYYSVLSAILLAFCTACILQGDAAEARFGEKDPSEAVADETAGQCIPLLAILPANAESPARGLLFVAIAFFAFRILDIIKPPPAKGWQRIPGGWGILIDDLVAGVYAALLVVIAQRWL